MSSLEPSAGQAQVARVRLPADYLLTVAALVLLAIGSGIACWWFMAHHGPIAGPSLAGMASYTGMWSLMMAAMMLPTVHRATGLYVMAVRRQDHPFVALLRIAALLAGYLFVWSAIGIPVYLIGVYVGKFVPSGSIWAVWFTAFLLAGSGLFQFSAIKERCLHHCQSPLAFVAEYMQRKGWDRDLRAGLEHGLTCLGCCAAMVAVLIGVGTMNVAWMIVLGTIAMVEKTWSHGRAFSRVAGVGMMIYAAFIVIYPQQAPAPHGLDGHVHDHGYIAGQADPVAALMQDICIGGLAPTGDGKLPEIPTNFHAEGH